MVIYSSFVDILDISAALSVCPRSEALGNRHIISSFTELWSGVRGTGVAVRGKQFGYLI